MAPAVHAVIDPGAAQPAMSSSVPSSSRAGGAAAVSLSSRTPGALSSSPRSPTMQRTIVAVVAVLAAFAVEPIAQQLPPYGSATEFRTDLAMRRAAAMQALGPDSVLILWSAPERVYST